MPARAAAAPSNAKLTIRIPRGVREVREGVLELRSELFGRAMLLTRSPDAAADLVQDTVERALRFERKYKPGTNLRAWIYRILTNVFCSRCRRRKLHHAAMLQMAADPGAWAHGEKRPEMERLSPVMEELLGDLPEPFRTVVILSDLEELSYQTMAKRLRVPIGTIMSRLHRGRRTLAEAVRYGDRILEAA